MQAAQRTGRYSEQSFCAIPRPDVPCIQDNLEEITPFERYRALQNLAPADSGLIILLHIPAADTLQDNLLPADYLQALLAETALVCKHLPNRPLLRQLHAYGDIALFSPQQLQQLFSLFRQYLQLPPNNFAWFSIGVTPGKSSWATLGKLRDAGFNRITLNGNDPCFQATESLYEAARALQFNTITMRVTYNPDNACSDGQRIQWMARLQPDRIVLEQADESLYDGEADAALVAFLEQAGYVQIAPSCFVLPDDELTETASDTPGSCFSQPVLPVIGLGAGASSQLGRLYYCNASRPDRYIRPLTASQSRLPEACGYRT